jgi:hypothetical protein
VTRSQRGEEKSQSQISNPKEPPMVASGKNHAGVEILIFTLFGVWKLAFVICA